MIPDEDRGLTVPHIYKVDEYAHLIAPEVMDRIQRKAAALKGLRVVNINSTYYGGGVAEILHSLVLLMNDVGLQTGWRMIHGIPDFFFITKKMHNALQGGAIHLTDRKREIYEKTIYENAIQTHLNHDCVVVHDPQPLPLINHYPRKSAWIWRCHIDLSRPHAHLWEYLTSFITKYDTAIYSIKEYSQKLPMPEHFFLPAINPFSLKNKMLEESEIEERLNHYKIPTDLPIISQISRFDRWKDPEGVIRAFQIARKEVDATLVLLGNMASDDPEGQEVFESLLSKRDDRILILACGDDTALVNALQRRSAVVLQKSIREGFGLTVTEAMWKGTPVIGGNVGGIRYQIDHQHNGFLVDSVEETAHYIVQLVKDRKLRDKMGQQARESVKKKFLMIRLLEQYLDLFAECRK